MFRKKFEAFRLKHVILKYRKLLDKQKRGFTYTPKISGGLYSMDFVRVTGLGITEDIEFFESRLYRHPSIRYIGIIRGLIIHNSDKITDEIGRLISEIGKGVKRKKGGIIGSGRYFGKFFGNYYATLLQFSDLIDKTAFISEVGNIPLIFIGYIEIIEKYRHKGFGKKLLALTLRRIGKRISDKKKKETPIGLAALVLKTDRNAIGFWESSLPRQMGVRRKAGNSLRYLYLYFGEVLSDMTHRYNYKKARDYEQITEGLLSIKRQQ